MNKIIELFQRIVSHGEIMIVQKGFLYEDRVDTREEKLILKDFVTLVRYLVKNKHLPISFKIKGEQSAAKIFKELNEVGISVEPIRNELNWIADDQYEVDALLHINLSSDKVKNLIDTFYVVEDAILIYPVGYKSWGEYFKESSTK